MFSYVAIEREYGSGGRAIAQQLAKSCRIPCYGHEILELAAQNLHMPVAQLERSEETTSNSLLYSIAMIGKTNACDPDLLMSDGRLFVAEQMAIRELASRGPAVFVGHCASEALKDVPGVLKVFVKSSMEDRRRRIIESYGIPENAVKSTISRFDRKRSAYYAANTSKSWNDFRNYDIVLDASVLKESGCVAALKSVLLLPDVPQ